MHIDSYEFGRIVVDGKVFTQDVIVFPDRVRDRWWRKEGHELCLDDLKEVLEEKPEVLVVGTGYSGCMVILNEVKKELKAKRIELIEKETKEACKVFNELSARKKVVAALHLTC